MGSVSSIHQGTISAKPVHHETSGGIKGSHGNHSQGNRISGSHGNRIGGSHESGTLHAEGGVHGKSLHGDSGRSVHGNSGRSVHGDSGDSAQNSAMAEIGGLIATLSSLSNQAQSLPLSAPSLPTLPQNQGYQPQPINYAFDDGSN